LRWRSPARTEVDVSEVERIVIRVRASRKYRSVCVDTVRRIAADEWSRWGALKPALKATKSRLHQIYGAYETGTGLRHAADALRSATMDGRKEAIRSACRYMLSLHTSTRERLPDLDRFYRDIYAHTGIPHVILDLACGLNPLALPWMGLGQGSEYHAYDIDGDRIALLNDYLDMAGVQINAHLQDVICDPPDEKGDLALLLKSAACLERQRRGSTLALLDKLAVDWVVVSFPVKSLGRREKGMPEHYAHQFDGMLYGRPWPVTRLDFPTELVFAVDKR